MAGGRAFKSNVRERREAERRMKALEKRQKKEEAAARKAERAAAIAHRKRTEITFLGRGVSERLRDFLGGTSSDGDYDDLEFTSDSELFDLIDEEFGPA